MITLTAAKGKRKGGSPGNVSPSGSGDSNLSSLEIYNLMTKQLIEVAPAVLKKVGAVLPFLKGIKFKKISRKTKVNFYNKVVQFRDSKATVECALGMYVTKHDGYAIYIIARQFNENMETIARYESKSAPVMNLDTISNLENDSVLEAFVKVLPTLKNIKVKK